VVEDIAGQTWGTTGGELSGGVLIRPGILEHSTNGMNSKHEESSLEHIKRAYKIFSITFVF